MVVSSRARAALEVASEVVSGLGVSFDAARVLRDRSNVIIAFDERLVARVPGSVGSVRPGDAWMRREVAVASFLARRGAPVVGPTELADPGPHAHSDTFVTLWQFEPTVEKVDPLAAGRALRVCHEMLEDLDVAVVEGHNALDEALRLLDTDVMPFTGEERTVLRDWGRRAAAAIAGEPVQVVHGDAHLGNVVASARGPLWNDWEDTHAASRAWDLGCLHAPAILGWDDGDEVAAMAYGDAPEGVEAATRGRLVQAVVWTAVAAAFRREGPERARDLLMRVSLGTA